MSKMVFYMEVKPFLAQWLTYHFGDPVTIPARSAENACIRRFVALNPKGKDYVPMKPGEGCVAVSIPETKQRKTICWNYMSKTACAALTEVIEDTFKMQMWLELNEMSRCGCTLLKCIRAWCENNGIDTEYDYTLKMRFQRMRNSYLKNGVDLRRRSKGIA